jgi:hypothetical protein
MQSIKKKIMFGLVSTTKTTKKKTLFGAEETPSKEDTD